MERAGAGHPIAEFMVSLDEALRLSAGRRERVLREVEDHLVDAAAALATAGMSQSQAEAEAVSRFGSAGHIARRFPPDPLGVAQRASGTYDTWRLKHPWLSVTSTVVASFAVVKVLLWPVSVVATGMLLLPWMLVYAIVNRRLQSRVEPGFRLRLSGWLGSRPASPLLVMLGPFVPPAIVASLVWGPHPLLMTMLVELACVAVVVIAQPNWNTGWSARHPGAAHDLLVAGWAAALAFPITLMVVSGFSRIAIGTAFLPLFFLSLGTSPWPTARRWATAHPVAANALQWLPLDAVTIAAGWPVTSIATVLGVHLFRVGCAILVCDRRRVAALRPGFARRSLVGGDA